LEKSIIEGSTFLALLTSSKEVSVLLLFGEFPVLFSPGEEGLDLDS